MSQISTKSLELLLKWLKLCGVWSDDKKISKKRAVLAFLTHILLIEVFVVLVIVFIANANNIEDFSEAFVIMPTFLGVTFKTLNLIFMKNKIFKFMKNLKELIEHENWIEAQNGTHWERIIGKIQKLFKVIGIIVITGFCFGCLVPFLTRELLYKMWFPYDYKTNELLRWASIVYQILGCMYCVPILLAFNVLPVILMFYVIGSVEELSERLKAITTKSQKPKTKKIFVVWEFLATTSRQSAQPVAETTAVDEHLKELQKCIEIHLKVQTLEPQEISKMFGRICWLQGFFSIGILCTTAFSMTIVRYS
jgi:7tm Odorant receptor